MRWFAQPEGGCGGKSPPAARFPRPAHRRRRGTSRQRCQPGPLCFDVITEPLKPDRYRSSAREIRPGRAPRAAPRSRSAARAASSCKAVTCHAAGRDMSRSEAVTCHPAARGRRGPTGAHRRPGSARTARRPRWWGNPRRRRACTGRPSPGSRSACTRRAPRWTPRPILQGCGVYSSAMWPRSVSYEVTRAVEVTRSAHVRKAVVEARRAQLDERAVILADPRAHEGQALCLVPPGLRLIRRQLGLGRARARGRKHELDRGGGPRRQLSWRGPRPME